MVQSYGVALAPGSGGRSFARCPFHDDKRASFSTYVDPVGVQRWGCFACEEKGDVVDFVAKQHGVDTGEAARILTGEARNTQRPALKPRPAPERAAPAETWRQIVPVPQEAGPPPGPGDFHHREHGTPAVVWTYLDGQGGLVGYVCRFNKPDGSKVILPFSYGQDGQKPAAWDFKAFNDPRPLYGLQNLAANPGAQVLVVEGEKTADAAQRLFPTLAVVTWPGGSSAVAKADWSALQGRKVCIWPDADSQRYGSNDERAGQTKPLDGQPGTKAALKIAAILKAGITDYVRVVRLPDPATDPSAPGDGWDLADGEAEGWDTARAVDFLKAHLAEPWEPKADPPQRKPRQAEQTPRAEPPKASAKEPQAAPAVNDNAPPHGEDYGPPEHVGGYGQDEAYQPAETYQPDEWPDSAFEYPFMCLGQSEGKHVFLTDKGVVESVAASSMKGSTMFNLAPLSWWATAFPSKSGVNWDEAADAVIQKSRRMSLFDPCRVRGLGAWEDEGRVVVHLGDRLLVDGVPTPIRKINSRYIYVLRPKVDKDLPKPATAREAYQFVQLCEMLSWERPIYGKLLAGWCAVAHVCGAVRWRPHIWVTGPAGSGKTWAYENILEASLGDFAQPCTSSSTEAGIRQKLGSDARPVIFDEAEPGTDKGQTRMTCVLELARQASAGGAGILKGTVSGQGQEFRIRSCFAFSSIVVALNNEADRSRITTLSLCRNTDPDAAEQFQKICEKLAEVMTPGFAARLRARCIKMIPQIRESLDVFSNVLTPKLKGRRAGDQVGAILAGAWCLCRDRAITTEEAEQWVSGQEWDAAKSTESETDEKRLLLRLLQQPVQIDPKGGSGAPIRRTVGEVCRALMSGIAEPTWELDAGHDALGRIGIRMRGDDEGEMCLIISDNHPAIRRAMDGTPWETGWGRLLARINRAKRLTGFRFAGALTRAVRVPISETPLAQEK